MKKYLRFGEIPKNEKSVNFLKLSVAEREDFSWTLENCGIDAAIKNVSACAFENGVSVFEMGADGLPVIHGMKEAYSLAGRIGEKIYQLSGDEIGRGNDGEPIIKNIKIEKTRRIATEKLEKHILEFLATHFLLTIPTENAGKKSDNYDIRKYGCENQINFSTGEVKFVGGSSANPGFVKMPYHEYYYFRGFQFYFPVPGFDVKK